MDPEYQEYLDYLSYLESLEKEKSLQQEQSQLSSQIKDVEAPFNLGTSIAGDNMVGRGLGNAFTAARDVYRNPPTARDVGAFGTRMVGAVGGALGTTALTKNPFAIPAAMTVGEEVANQFNQYTGLEDDTSFVQEDVPEMLGRGVMNYLLPGAGSVTRAIGEQGFSQGVKTSAKGIANAFTAPVRAPITAAKDAILGQPAREVASGLADNAPGRMMAEFGVGAKNTARETALVGRTQGVEQGLTDSGILDESVDAFDPVSLRFVKTGGEFDVTLPDGRVVKSTNLPETFVKEAVIDKELPAIARQKSQTVADLDYAMKEHGAINTSEAAVQGVNFFELLPPDAVKLYQRLQKFSLTKDSGQAMEGFFKTLERDIDEVGTGASPYIFRTYMDFFTQAPKGQLSLQEADDLLANLYFFQRAAKKFDLAQAAKGMQGDSATYQYNQGVLQMMDMMIPRLKGSIATKSKEVLELVRGDEFLLQRLDPNISNRLLQAPDNVIEVLGDRYHSLKQFKPVLSRFNQQNLQFFTPKVETSFLESATKNRGFGAAMRDKASSLLSTPEQQMMKRQANAWQRSREIQAARAGLLPPTSAPLSLPRNVTEIMMDGAKRRLAAQMLAETGILGVDSAYADPEEAFMQMPPFAQENAIRQAVQIFPDMFEPNVDGYKSVVGGKFGDPMERDMHLRATLDKDLSVEDEAQILAPLLGKNQHVALGKEVLAPPTRNQTPMPSVDMFDLNSALGDVEMAQDETGSYVPDSVRMLEQLTKSQSLRNNERSGY